MKTRLALLALPLLLAAAISCKEKSDETTAPVASASPSAPTAASSPSAPPSGGAAAPAPSAGGAAAPADGFEGTIALRVTTGKNPPVEVLVTSKGNKLRIDVGKGEHMIYDASTGAVTALSDAKKTATTATAPAGDDSQKPQITKTGLHENIGGVDCENWDIAEWGGKHSSACVAAGIPAFDPASMGPAGTTAPVIGGWLKSFRGQRVFPLKSVLSDSTGAIVSRFQTASVAPAPVDNAAFEIPPGFH